MNEQEKIDEIREATLTADANGYGFDGMAEEKRKLGGDCDATEGDHVVMKVGKYAFCVNCGETLKGVRYNHSHQNRKGNKMSILPPTTCRLDIDCSSVLVKQKFEYGKLGEDGGPKIMGEFETSPIEALELAAALRVFAQMVEAR